MVELRALTPTWLDRMGQGDPLLNSRRMSGPGYIALLDGEPIAAAGLGRICGMEFFAWAVITPKARASKLLMRQLTREAKRRYPIIRDLIKAEVVNAETINDKKFCRWLEMLDFKKIPVVRYAWVREGIDNG